jgi:hypothetical protein
VTRKIRASTRKIRASMYGRREMQYDVVMNPATPEFAE